MPLATPFSHEVLDPVGDALSGQVLVHTTITYGTPAQAREMIGLPEALLLDSGSEDASEAHRE